MKKIFNISLIALLAMAMVSCEMDYFRSDTMTSAQLEADPGAAVYTTDGNYAMFKDCLLYNGSTYSGNTYIRHYFQMSEFRGDNMTLSGRTTDPLYEAYTYSDNATLRNNNYYWFVAYKIIYGANSNINAIPTGASTESDHMKGENLFMRAIAHFHLVTLYAKPYSCGRDNLGVVLRTSTDCSETKRATVGEVYDQVVADLIEAAELMKNGSRRGDAGYIGYDAAMALLSRVYLYMGENDKVLEITNQLLGGNPAANLDPDLRNIFVNARSSKETLWCVAHTAVETQERSSVGSMYYSPDGTGGTGWCEIYWSDPLMELFLRHPEDKRFNAYFEQYGATGEEDKRLVHWAVPSDGNDFYENEVTNNVTKNAEGKWAFTYQSKQYVVEEEMVDGYPQTFIQYNGKKTRCYVRPNADMIVGVRQSFPLYMMNKFSGQDGDPNLSSPIMIRWAEVVLNRAEAKAKLGDDAGALADVNVIRQRAGIPAWDGSYKWNEHGYDSVLEVVLDERRMELCFEAHRPQDVYRNGLKMDRQFAGVHTWEVIDYTDNRIPYQIPSDEYLVSGIEQNPR